MRPAVFIDKDGTLVEDVPYNVDPAQVRPMPGVPEGLRALGRAGMDAIVVSNQPGIALGYFDEAALLESLRAVKKLFADNGCRLAGVYFCPHHPTGRVVDFARECGCRKPKPGLILRAALDHDVDTRLSWMIGDILNDVEAGRLAGCRTVFIDNGHETEWVMSSLRAPDVTVRRFDEAVEAILNREAADAVLA